MMIARVERISRVNGAAQDVGAYGQRQGYADSDGGHAFEQELDSAMQQKRIPAPQHEIRIDQPYVLSVTRATHSLFYQQGLPETIRQGQYLHEIG